MAQIKFNKPETITLYDLYRSWLDSNIDEEIFFTMGNSIVLQLASCRDEKLHCIVYGNDLLTGIRVFNMHELSNIHVTRRKFKVILEELQ